LHFHLFNAGDGAFPLRALDPVIGLEIIRLSAAPEDSST
jgi:hypothetical protein